MGSKAREEPAPFGRACGKALRLMRRSRGLSLDELGKGTGISGKQWSRIERGDTPLTVDRLDSAARFMRSSVVDVITTADQIVLLDERMAGGSLGALGWGA